MLPRHRRASAQQLCELPQYVAQDPTGGSHAELVDGAVLATVFRDQAKLLGTDDGAQHMVILARMLAPGYSHRGWGVTQSWAR